MWQAPSPTTTSLPRHTATGDLLTDVNLSDDHLLLFRQLNINLPSLFLLLFVQPNHLSPCRTFHRRASV
jgi:hypothetical protein